MKTIYRLMRWNHRLRSHRIKLAAIWCAHRFRFRHLFVRCDPVLACNLRCQMCHFSGDQYRHEHQGRLETVDFERIAGMLLPRTLQLVIGCAAEPTLHPQWMEFLRVARRHRVPFVGLVSNGQRFDVGALRGLLEHGLDELTLSLHGVRKETYERFMSGASHARLLETLATLNELKVKTGSAKPRLRLNYTVNPENLDELTELLGVFGAGRIDAVQVRPIEEYGGRYTGRFTTADVDRYRAAIESLAAACRDRGVVLLVHRFDPFHSNPAPAEICLPAVYRYVSPELVWKPEFAWREESYDAFCRRIGWERWLMQGVFLSRKRLEQSALFRTSLGYEVMM